MDWSVYSLNEKCRLVFIISELEVWTGLFIKSESNAWNGLFLIQSTDKYTSM